MEQICKCGHSMKDHGDLVGCAAHNDDGMMCTCLRGSSFQKYSDMTIDEKRIYMATGRVTVGKLSTLTDHSIKVFYVGKVRGHIVGSSAKYKFDSPEEARKNADDMRTFWRNEIAQSK